MQKLVIPPALSTEFSTVDLIWNSKAETRRVDCLALSWIKYEKQLRRLFSFLIFQHPNITAKSLDEVIAAFVQNRNLYPETFIAGIRALGVTPLPKLMGDDHERLWPEIKRIKIYRNKIMHGQITGQSIKSEQLERDVRLLVEWIAVVASVADASFGYDGLRRNTYVAAKSAEKLQVQKYPFSTPDELRAWLSKLVS